MFRKSAGFVLTVAAVLLAVPALGQDGGEMPEMTPEQKEMMDKYVKAGTPGPQHEALAKSVGSYELKVKSWHEPGGPPVEDTGFANRTMKLDGRVLVEEVTSTMTGTPFTGQLMMGFDNVTGQYWGVWVDSMSTGMMVSEGTCDDTHESCTFTGTYNDPLTGQPTKTRMVSRRTGPTTETFEMYGPAPDGSGEMKMMEMVYTKK